MELFEDFPAFRLQLRVKSDGGIYLSDYSYEFDWQLIPNRVADHFSSVSTVAGTTATFATSCLPSGHHKMAGLQSAFWSGYTASTYVADGITGVGEIVLIREDGATWKAYEYPIGYSGTQRFIGAEFKSFSGHHFVSGAPVPINDVFGNIPWPCRTDGQ
jgi:hypothetical protein